jgi:hypothetical protein
MLSLLKKKSDASAASQMPPWHPNFRNYEKLPDIKVVRTAFFINGAALFAALALLIYYGFQEWQLHVLHGQVVDAEQRISQDKPASNQAVMTFSKFQAEEAKIKEVDTFVLSRLKFSELLLHLGGTLPANIAIDNVDLREIALVLRLSVRGTRDAAAGYATAYVEQLKEDESLLERFEPAEMTSISPNPATGRLTVELTLRLKGAKK